jgi:hypothetical protein
MGEKMYRKNKIVGVVAAFFFSGSSLVAIPLASAETTATSSVISTQELCTWFVDDLPSEVALSNADAEAEYEGVDFEVSENPDASLKVYVSGNLDTGTFDANTECTWYNTDAIDGIEITLAVATDAVTSTPDNSLGFDLTDSPYEITQTQLTCQNKADVGEWSTNNQVLSQGAINSPLATLLQEATSKVLADAQSPSDKCSLDLTFALTIPGEMTPSSPGAAYTFNLPTVTWTVNTLPLETP